MHLSPDKTALSLSALSQAYVGERPRAADLGANIQRRTLLMERAAIDSPSFADQHHVREDKKTNNF